MLNTTPFDLRPFDLKLDAVDNPKDALNKMQTLAESGNCEAMMILADSYRDGKVCYTENTIRVDIEKAAFWYKRLAQNNNAEALERIWLMYHDAGENKKGADALKSAANAGVTNSMRFLGMCYIHGIRSFTQNFAEGLMWIRMAAKSGDVGAQLELANIYLEGNLVEKDLVKSYMWLVIAAAKEISVAEEYYSKSLNRFNEFHWDHEKEPVRSPPGQAVTSRNALSSNLSKDQILKAQQMAEICVSKNYDGFD